MDKTSMNYPGTLLQHNIQDKAFQLVVLDFMIILVLCHLRRVTITFTLLDVNNHWIKLL